MTGDNPLKSKSKLSGQSVWVEEIRIFFAALMFYTRLPTPAWVGYADGTWSDQHVDLFASYQHQSARYFPLIGLIIGGAGAFTYWLAQVVWPISVAVLLSMIVTIVLTGALHEDGLADACDGFGGGWSKEKILAIMKDSRLGLFGVVGIGLTLALKFFTLTSLQLDFIPGVMIAGHSLSRFTAITFLRTHAYAREDVGGERITPAESSPAVSKAKPMVQQMSWPNLIVAGIFGILPLFFLTDVVYPHGLFFLALGPLLVSKWLLGQYFRHRIGGYTGDCLGATQQLTEVIFYLFVAGLSP